MFSSKLDSGQSTDDPQPDFKKKQQQKKHKHTNVQIFSLPPPHSSRHVVDTNLLSSGIKPAHREKIKKYSSSLWIHRSPHATVRPAPPQKLRPRHVSIKTVWNQKRNEIKLQTIIWPSERPRTLSAPSVCPCVIVHYLQPSTSSFHCGHRRQETARRTKQPDRYTSFYKRGIYELL